MSESCAHPYKKCLVEGAFGLASLDRLLLQQHSDMKGKMKRMNSRQYEMSLYSLLSQKYLNSKFKVICCRHLWNVQFEMAKGELKDGGVDRHDNPK